MAMTTICIRFSTGLPQILYGWVKLVDGWLDSSSTTNFHDFVLSVVPRCTSVKRLKYLHREYVDYECTFLNPADAIAFKLQWQ